MVERKTGRRMSVARQILLLQLALLALVIGVEPRSQLSTNAETATTRSAGR